MTNKCSKCRKERKIQARGLCFTCYNIEYKKANPNVRVQRKAAEQRRRASNPQLTREKQAAYKKDLAWPQRVLLNNGSITSKNRRTNLSIEFLQALQEETARCRCCGTLLDYNYNGRHIRPPNLATLDKIIPSLGYAPSNVAIICFTCNSRKRDMSISDLQMIIDYIKNSN